MFAPKGHGDIYVVAGGDSTGMSIGESEPFVKIARAKNRLLPSITLL